MKWLAWTLLVFLFVISLAQPVNAYWWGPYSFFNITDGSSNLTMHWSMDNATTSVVWDDTNTSKDLRNVFGNPVINASGKINNHTSYDGINDGFTSNGDILDIANFSSAVWFKKDDLVNDYLFDIGGAAGEHWINFGSFSGKHYPICNTRHAAGSLNTGTWTNATIITGQWYFIVCTERSYTASGTIDIFWYNETSFMGHKSNSHALTGITDSNSNASLGTWSGASSVFFNGGVDEFSIWNERNITKLEADALWNFNGSIGIGCNPVSSLGVCNVSGAPANNAPVVTLSFPGDGSRVAGTNASLVANYTDGDGENMTITFEGNNTLLYVQENVTTGSTLIFNWTGLSRGTTYQWFSSADDGTDNTSATNFTFTVNQLPYFTLHFPPNSLVTTNTTVPLIATFFDDDNDTMNITFVGDGGVVYTQNNVANGTKLTFNWSGLSENNHTWLVNATDVLGEEGSSSQRWFVVTSSTPSSGGAGAVSIILALITFTLAYYAINLNEDNWHLKLLFFLGSLIVMIVSANIAIEYIQGATPAPSNQTDLENTATLMYFGLVWFSYVTLALMLIKYIADMLRNIGGKQEGVTP